MFIDLQQLPGQYENSSGGSRLEKSGKRKSALHGNELESLGKELLAQALEVISADKKNRRAIDLWGNRKPETVKPCFGHRCTKIIFRCGIPASLKTNHNGSPYELRADAFTAMGF